MKYYKSRNKINKDNPIVFSFEIQRESESSIPDQYFIFGAGERNQLSVKIKTSSIVESTFNKTTQDTVNKLFFGNVFDEQIIVKNKIIVENNSEKNKFEVFHPINNPNLKELNQNFQNFLIVKGNYYEKSTHDTVEKTDETFVIKRDTSKSPLLIINDKNYFSSFDVNSIKRLRVAFNINSKLVSISYLPKNEKQWNNIVTCPIAFSFSQQVRSDYFYFSTENEVTNISSNF